MSAAGLLALLLTATPEVAAATTRPALIPGWVVDRWTVEDGLPLDHITDIAQTPDGMLWLATFDGLVRFDGRTFTVMRTMEHPALGTNRFVQLTVGGDGELWILTEDGGLIRHHRRQLQRWEPDELGAPGHRLIPDAPHPWLGTQAGLIRLVDGTPEPVLDLYPSALTIEHDNTIWAGEADRRELLRGEPGGSARVVHPADGSSAGYVFDLHLSEDGALWVAASSGALVHRDGEGLRRLAGLDARVCEVLETDAGELLLRADGGWWSVEGDTLTPELRTDQRCYRHLVETATERGGALWRVAGSRLLRDDAVVLESDVELGQQLWDRDGSLWLISSGGLWQVRRASAAPVRSAFPEGTSPIRSLYRDSRGDRWLVSDLALLRQSPDGAEERIPNDQIAPSHPDMAQHVALLYSISEAPDGRRWIATQTGLCDIDAAEPEACVRSPEPYALFTDRDGVLWVTTKRGVRRGLDGPMLLEGGEREAMVRSFAQTADGTVWMGTIGEGLLSWREDRGLARMTRDDGLPTDRIRGLHADADGVWVATEDAGLCRVEGEAVRCLDRRHGLFDDTLHSVHPDAHGRLWMSTNRGVFWAREADVRAVLGGRLAAVQSLAYTERDGMLDREANGTHFPQVLAEPGGRLLYPTMKGAVAFDPDALPPPPPPAVLLESLRAGGADRTAEALAGQALTLTPDESALSARWTVAEFRWHEQVRYRHRLIGYAGHEEWSVPSAEPQVRWSSLPPGEYRLEIAAGLGGAWSAPVAVAVIREPAFSETLWFSLSLGLLGVAVTGLGAGFRVRQLRVRQEELEDTVSERTQELATRNQVLQQQTRLLEQQTEQLAAQTQQLNDKNQQIQAQADRLSELDALKTRFIANVSHELRTPVTLIMGPLDDLQGASAALDEGARQSLGVARRNAQRLGELVGQLLDIARLDSDGLPLRARPGDLGALLRRISARFTTAAQHRDITLTVRTPGGPVGLYFDPEQLDRVVSNLLSNALKFTPDGGAIDLDLGVDAPDSPDAVATLSVTDTGIGIPAAQQDRLFDRFYQVDRGDARRYEGAGIGLALTRELVRLHGGDITVHSAPGQGATFTVTLPLGVAHLSPEEIDLSPSATTAAAAPPRPPALEAGAGDEEDEETGERSLVLVVEDHPDMRAYLAAHLRERFAVALAASGAEALAAIQARRPAAVVSDVMMPGMDGLELCRRLRAEPELADLPVLLVSAKASAGDRLAGLEVADDYLSKPFRMPELLARVHNLLRRPAAAAADATPAEAEEAALPERPAVDVALLERLRAAVGDNLDTPRFGASALARVVAMSPRQLQREMQRLTSQSPTDFIRQLKLEAAAAMLRAGRFATVGEVAAAVGFSPNYFSRVYAAWAGHPPTADLNADVSPPEAGGR